MVDPISREVWTYRALYLAVALLFFFLRLLPMGSTAGTWPGPDLMLCLTLAWVLRRPDYLPAGMVVAVLLLEDFLLMRPPGLWTAIVLVATEFLRGRSALTRELGFAMEWVLVAAVQMAMLLAYRLVYALAFVPQPGFGYAMVQTLATILCYPVIVGLSHGLLSLRKPAMGEVDAMGRRL